MNNPKNITSLETIIISLTVDASEWQQLENKNEKIKKKKIQNVFLTHYDSDKLKK